MNWCFPEEDLEFRQAHSRVAGEMMVWREAIDIINTRASEAFLNDNLELATTLKSMAKIFKKRESAKSGELNGYITESIRRGNKNL